MSEKKVVMRIRALYKRFGAQSVLQGIDLDIYAGEKIAIIKFASVLGEIAAQFAQGITPSFDLKPFALSRFNR